VGGGAIRIPPSIFREPPMDPNRQAQEGERRPAQAAEEANI
jgi:hypothetical protein